MLLLQASLQESWKSPRLHQLSSMPTPDQWQCTEGETQRSSPPGRAPLLKLSPKQRSQGVGGEGRMPYEALGTVRKWKGGYGCQTGNQQSPFTVLPDCHLFLLIPDQWSLPHSVDFWASPEEHSYRSTDWSNQSNKETLGFFHLLLFLSVQLPLIGHALLTLRPGGTSSLSSTWYHLHPHQAVLLQREGAHICFTVFREVSKHSSLCPSVSRNP